MQCILSGGFYLLTTTWNSKYNEENPPTQVMCSVWEMTEQIARILKTLFIIRRRNDKIDGTKSQFDKLSVHVRTNGKERKIRLRDDFETGCVKIKWIVPLQSINSNEFNVFSVMSINRREM